MSKDDAPHENMPTAESEAWALLEGELSAALHADHASAATQEAERDTLPTALADTLVRDGERLMRSSHQGEQIATASAHARRRPRMLLWSGWLVAAAAMLFVVAVPRPSAPSTAPSAEALAQVDAQLRLDSTATRLAWTPTADRAAVGARGTVAWSRTSQVGVMRIAGLLPNDRTRWQYQLWIFDKRRDQRYPVDGGVFDIPSDRGEVLVPIRARVPVGEATMFVVTVEPAGGVVVSTRERIALLANVGG